MNSTIEKDFESKIPFLVNLLFKLYKTNFMVDFCGGVIVVLLLLAFKSLLREKYTNIHKKFPGKLAKKFFFVSKNMPEKFMKKFSEIKFFLSDTSAYTQPSLV